MHGEASCPHSCSRKPGWETPGPATMGGSGDRDVGAQQVLGVLLEMRETCLGTLPGCWGLARYVLQPGGDALR